MGVTVTLVSRRDEVVRSMQDIAAKRMEAACMTVRDETKQMLTGTRHGLRYKVPTTGKRIGEGRSKAGTGVWYTASAPGEAPAVRLGALRSSIDYAIHGAGRALVGEIGTPQLYGVHLEYGTIHMGARPWLRKTFEACTARIIELWRRPWF
jgi:hypothetical protein